MSQPLVSVIVPTYNVERYVEDCIDSLLSQTYSNIEIIVIDDGSKDATVYLLNQYKDKIKLIAHDNNQGQGARRNEGLTLVSGKYIYFVDSDDWIEPETIEEAVDQLEKTDADLVRFNGKVFYEGDAALVKEGRYDFSSQLDHQHVYNQEEALQKNRQTYSASPCLYLVKKSLIDDYSLMFLEGVLHEDEYFTTKLFTLTQTMTYLDRTFYHRRYRVASTMTENTNLHKVRSFDSYLEVFAELETLYHSGNLTETQKGFVKRQLLSIYNGLQTASVHPESKRKLRTLKSITLKDKVYLVASRAKLFLFQKKYTNK
ncbi:glycosyltransferase family 2 protein [Alkalibacterium pelagium]|uniref:Glycosyl transferase family 2 n=1 Tax=Alkalibacterium pelagium TaxID=426702 RepID=A0A1H7NLM3_9LACT|nr:glycosyltransferase family 2 protein [Alkalibacterium pelagium]GEN51442.1 glycosyl transferase [Alkalibacterium pelagium]SEL24294.1 Glycosyl transferase family 2 [Alkalibacterium pelagium]